MAETGADTLLFKPKLTTYSTEVKTCLQLTQKHSAVSCHDKRRAHPDRKIAKDLVIGDFPDAQGTSSTFMPHVLQFTLLMRYKNTTGTRQIGTNLNSLTFNLSYVEQGSWHQEQIG